MEQEKKPYVVIGKTKDSEKILRDKNLPLVQFPLSAEDQQAIDELKVQFRQEKDCAALAAPQIGHKKRIIIFSCPITPEMKKWRPDLTDSMPETLWINPTYVGVGDERHEDYESGFSVPDVCGKVSRFKTIRYQAFDERGHKVEGKASGFLARIIQHEVDLINGILFTDIVIPGTLENVEEYRAKRKKAFVEQEKKPYVVIDKTEGSAEILRDHRLPLVKFPLSKEDQQVIDELKTQFRKEENCAGLAAPQIGRKKRMIIFSCPITPEMQKWRPDLAESMPETLWINPKYIAVGDERNEDYEACFSVPDVCGKVSRFKTIRYEAFDENGKKIEGEARGFLARIMQHEIDHINGVLFTDIVIPGTLEKVEEYRARRKKAFEEAQKVKS